jgi:hypothetical protein
MIVKKADRKRSPPAVIREGLPEGIAGFAAHRRAGI